MATMLSIRSAPITSGRCVLVVRRTVTPSDGRIAVICDVRCICADGGVRRAPGRGVRVCLKYRVIRERSLRTNKD